MWTCNYCENTNEDKNHVCDVCGATYPDVTLTWKNKDGKDSSCGNKATLSWTANYCKSSFAIYAGKSYYLTNKTSVEFPVFDSPKEGTIYFCSTGGYIQHKFMVGNSAPVIDIFTVSPLKKEYVIGDRITINWRVKNAQKVSLQGAYNAPNTFYNGNSEVIELDGTTYEQINVIGTDGISKDSKRIELKVKEPKIPVLQNYTIVTENPKVRDKVEIKVRATDCSKLKYYYDDCHSSICHGVKSGFGDTYEFTFTVTAWKENNKVKVELIPYELNSLEVFSDTIKKYSTKKWINFNAKIDKPKILNISHSDVYIKKGDSFVVSWRTENVKHVKVGLKSIGGFFGDFKGSPTLYGPNGEATITNIRCDDTVYITFIPEYGDEITRSIDIYCRRFIKVFKKFHKDDK